MSLPETQAFLGKMRVGDRVEVHRLRFEGEGHIDAVSSSPEVGFGTKLYPTFHVTLDDGTSDWYTGSSLTKVK